MESINVVINDHHTKAVPNEERDSLLMFPYDTRVVSDKEKNIVLADDDSESSNLDPEESVSDQLKCSNRVQKNHSSENIKGDLNFRVTT